ALPALVEALTDPDQYVRTQAAELIRQMGPGAKAAVPALRELVKAGDPEARLQAMRVLQQVRPGELKDVATSLVELLTDKNAAVRYQAAQLLGEIGADAREVAPKLVELLKS